MDLDHRGPCQAGSQAGSQAGGDAGLKEPCLSGAHVIGIRIEPLTQGASELSTQARGGTLLGGRRERVLGTRLGSPIARFSEPGASHDSAPSMLVALVSPTSAAASAHGRRKGRREMRRQGGSMGSGRSRGSAGVWPAGDRLAEPCGSTSSDAAAPRAVHPGGIPRGVFQACYMGLEVDLPTSASCTSFKRPQAGQADHGSDYNAASLKLLCVGGGCPSMQSAHSEEAHGNVSAHHGATNSHLPSARAADGRTPSGVGAWVGGPILAAKHCRLSDAGWTSMRRTATAEVDRGETPSGAHRPWNGHGVPGIRRAVTEDRVPSSGPARTLLRTPLWSTKEPQQGRLQEDVPTRQALRGRTQEDTVGAHMGTPSWGLSTRVQQLPCDGSSSECEQVPRGGLHQRACTSTTAPAPYGHPRVVDVFADDYEEIQAGGSLDEEQFMLPLVPCPEPDVSTGGCPRSRAGSKSHAASRRGGTSGDSTISPVCRLLSVHSYHGGSMPSTSPRPSSSQELTGMKQQAVAGGSNQLNHRCPTDGSMPALLTCSADSAEPGNQRPPESCPKRSIASTSTTPRGLSWNSRQLRGYITRDTLSASYTTDEREVSSLPHISSGCGIPACQAGRQLIRAMSSQQARTLASRECYVSPTDRLANSRASLETRNARQFFRTMSSQRARTLASREGFVSSTDRLANSGVSLETHNARQFFRTMSSQPRPSSLEIVLRSPRSGPSSFTGRGGAARCSSPSSFSGRVGTAQCSSPSFLLSKAAETLRDPCSSRPSPPAATCDSATGDNGSGSSPGCSANTAASAHSLVPAHPSWKRRPHSLEVKSCPVVEHDVKFPGFEGAEQGPCKMDKTERKLFQDKNCEEGVLERVQEPSPRVPQEQQPRGAAIESNNHSRHSNHNNPRNHRNAPRQHGQVASAPEGPEEEQSWKGSLPEQVAHGGSGEAGPHLEAPGVRAVGQARKGLRGMAHPTGCGSATSRGLETQTLQPRRKPKVQILIEETDVTHLSCEGHASPQENIPHCSPSNIAGLRQLWLGCRLGSLSDAEHVQRQSPGEAPEPEHPWLGPSRVEEDEDCCLEFPSAEGRSFWADSELSGAHIGNPRLSAELCTRPQGAAKHSVADVDNIPDTLKSEGKKGKVTLRNVSPSPRSHFDRMISP